MVPKVRIELTTRGSSGHCSTTELLRQVVNCFLVLFLERGWDVRFLRLPPLRDVERLRSTALTSLSLREQCIGEGEPASPHSSSQVPGNSVFSLPPQYYSFPVRGLAKKNTLLPGTGKRIRTSTPLRALAPEASVSTIPPSRHELNCVRAYSPIYSAQVAILKVRRMLCQK